MTDVRVAADDESQDAEAWRVAEEFDQAAREPGCRPDPRLLAAVADTANIEVLSALFDALHELCRDDDSAPAEQYAEHMVALAPMLSPDTGRAVLAAVDVHVALLRLWAGDSDEALRRVNRCNADLVELLPGLLGFREMVLAGLAETDGRHGDAHDHAIRARDLFVEYEWWPEAAGVAEAAAGANPTMTADALDEWRRAAELFGLAGEPDEATRCAGYAIQLVSEAVSDPAADPGTAAALCATARAMASDHGLPEQAARLALQAAGWLDFDLPWAQIVEAHELGVRELSELGIDPAELRIIRAEVDDALGRWASLHGRNRDAERLFTAAASTYHEAGMAAKALEVDARLVAARSARNPNTPTDAIQADRFTDPGIRSALLTGEAMQLVDQGRHAEALDLMREATAAVPADNPLFTLFVEGASAVARKVNGDTQDTAETLAMLDEKLATERLPPAFRAKLAEFADVLRDLPPPELERLSTAAEIDAAVAEVHGMPPDAPDRARRAAMLVASLLRSDPPGDSAAAVRPLEGLLEIADSAPPSIRRWHQVRARARMRILRQAVDDGTVTDLEEARARLDEVAAEGGNNARLRREVELTRIQFQLVDAMRESDMGSQVELLRQMAEHLQGEAGRGSEPMDLLAQVFQRYGEIVTMIQRNEDPTDSLRELLGVVEHLPPGDTRTSIADTVRNLSRLVEIRWGGPAGRLGDDAFGALMERLGRVGTVDPDAHNSLMMELLYGGAESDPRRIDATVDVLRKALELTEASPHRIFYLTRLAMALWWRYEVRSVTDDLREARTLLVQARELAGGPHHGEWSNINNLLADADRLLGESADFHRSALAGLRRHIWQVLVQSDLVGAELVARAAATDALATARRCLVANDPAAAITALDAGRGLALFAATQVTSVADQLAAGGHRELARHWRTAVATGDPEQLPRELRRTVLSALTEGGAATDLLDPPELPEIQRALAAIDADAVVYLVPGTAPTPGYAVIAPATGAPSYLVLLDLDGERQPDVELYLTALNRRSVTAAVDQPRDLVVPDTGTAEALKDSLDALTSWAWRAAMGPLIEGHLARLPAHPSGRPPRVVLVPMGDLARVPWQAARRPDGTYAVELIATSQAASARMLCRSAALSQVPSSAVGLLVGDPDTTGPTGAAADLAAARLEAFAVRQAFYSASRYLGRRPDGSPSPSGTGTRRQIRDWLVAADPGAGSVLHLACHGVIESGDRRSTAYLLLAGGERLTAEELVELLATAPDRAIGLVVLAACRTGVSLSSYDEAYSLGTAFLAGGVRSVLSTQWAVPDGETSVMMYMFHHFLRAAGLSSWSALRAAQLWMLDPARAVPPSMPGPLRRQLRPHGLDAVIAWAGFVHWGQ